MAQYLPQTGLGPLEDGRGEPQKPCLEAGVDWEEPGLIPPLEGAGEQTNRGSTRRHCLVGGSISGMRQFWAIFRLPWLFSCLLLSSKRQGSQLAKQTQHQSHSTAQAWQVLTGQAGAYTAFWKGLAVTQGTMGNQSGHSRSPHSLSIPAARLCVTVTKASRTILSLSPISSHKPRATSMSLRPMRNQHNSQHDKQLPATLCASTVWARSSNKDKLRRKT